MNICITGGSGPIGHAITSLLEEHHNITVLDIVPPSFTCHYIKGSVTDYPLLQNILTKQDIVIHLAVAVQKDDYKTPTVPFNTNVLGTYNVLQSVKTNGVKQCILFSEAPVHISSVQKGQWNSSPNDDFLYDTTKHLQEVLAEDFSNMFDMNITILRIGHVVNGIDNTDLHGVPLSKVAYCKGGWISLLDLSNVVQKVIHLEQQGFHRYDVIGSIEAIEQFDVGTTEKELQYQFKHRFFVN